MSFSYSAPTVSAEQLQAELEEFTDEECKALDDDLHGHPDSFLPDPPPDSVLDRSIALFQAALDEIAEKKAYLEAVERDPELVERECNRIAFLKVAKWDPWAAAQRYVNYWQYRKKLFGEDRFLLPMRLTNGALTNDDLQLLRRGLLLTSPHDEAGRCVIACDRVKIKPRIRQEIDAWLRIFFYFLHIMSKDPNASKKGCIFLANLRGYDLFRNYNRRITKSCNILLDCFPLRFVCGHFIAGRDMAVVKTCFLPVLRQILSKYYRHRLLLHCGSEVDVLKDMKAYGLLQENLPACVGGTLVLKNFQAWLVLQEEQERLFYD